MKERDFCVWVRKREIIVFLDDKRNRIIGKFQTRFWESRKVGRE